MNIGDRLKKLRKELDLTQAAFASRIGSVQNTVTGYESGRRNPSAPVISLICREFGVSEDWLRTGAGEMFAPKSESALDTLAEERHLSRSEKILIEKILNLKPELRQGIIDCIVEVASALAADANADAVMSYPEAEIDIDAEVASFRAELEHQKKAGGGSSASGGSSVIG